MPTDEPNVAEIANGLVQKWAANPHEIHKRPPFRAHSFDGDGRFWVVGSTTVSVLHGAHGPRAFAEFWADALNRAHLQSEQSK